LPLHIPSTHTAASVSITPPLLWHARLSHASISRIKTLASRGSLGSVSENFSIHCQHCTLAKQSPIPFSVSESKSLVAFDLVHSDVWTSSEPSLSGAKYYVVFLMITLDFVGFTLCAISLKCMMCMFNFPPWFILISPTESKFSGQTLVENIIPKSFLIFSNHMTLYLSFHVLIHLNKMVYLKENIAT